MAFLWDKIMQLWDKLMWLCNVFCSERGGRKGSKEKYGLFLILKGGFVFCKANKIPTPYA